MENKGNPKKGPPKYKQKRELMLVKFCLRLQICIVDFPKPQGAGLWKVDGVDADWSWPANRRTC